MPATNSTIVRRLTGAVSSAIAVISIEGDDAAAMAEGHLRDSRGQAISLKESKARFALWRFSDTKLADEHVICLVRNRHLIEIHSHGGLAITSQIMEELQAAGCSLEATHAAHSCESTEANLSAANIRRAAEDALIQARTQPVASILLDQSQGALAREVDIIRSLLASGQESRAAQMRADLLSRADFGLKLTNPWRLTLAGPPNVGKSSLMNALCGIARVLVHHEPGTTRDAIETDLVIGGWPLVLTDTAGIRTTNENIEQQGIETAWQRWSGCDIGILVVDATAGWTIDHNRLLSGPATIIVAVNKCDAVNDTTVVADFVAQLQEQLSGRVGSVVGTSAQQPNGVDDLLATIRDYLDAQKPAPGAAVPFTKQQITAIKRL